MRTPAKANLILRVGEMRREDGRHEIETVFLPLPFLCDEVVVQATAPGTGLQLHCDGRPISPAPSSLEANLAFRAAQLFCQHFGIPQDWGIAIHKEIPVAAGLGGGSSDAAAVLRELCRLTGRSLDDGVQALAMSLGADVPFVLNPEPCIGRSIHGGSARCCPDR